MPTQLDLQKLTQQRLDEADDLLGIGRVDAAFYLAGYSIEMALKASICHTLDQPDFYKPDRIITGHFHKKESAHTLYRTDN